MLSRSAKSSLYMSIRASTGMLLADKERAKVGAVLAEWVAEYENAIAAEQDLEEKANDDAPMHGPYRFDQLSAAEQQKWVS